MTDNEIIKSLECLMHDNCEDCPYYRDDCVDRIKDPIELSKCALDLINRLQAENEKLKIENQSLRMAANSYKLHYNEAKVEAVKEFAERLKKECIIDRGYEILQEGTIDNLIKEMAGDIE